MSKSDPKEIQKVDRKRQVLSLLHQGVDVRTIAEQLSLSETHVTNLAREEMQYLTLQAQELQEHFLGLTWARTEKIMSRLLPVFDMEPPDATQEPDLEKRLTGISRYQRLVGDALRNYVALARLQKDILQVRGVDNKKNGNVNIEKMAINNITMTTGNELYQEALDSIHMDLHGETYPEKQLRLLEQLEVVQLPDDARLDKIEKAIENLNVGTDLGEDRPEDG